MDTLIATMCELTEAPGVSGYEQAVRHIMRRHLEPLGDVWEDNLGGIVCKKVGHVDGPNILITGHMDEIGFMVTRITKNGFLTFQNLGGWFDQVLLAQRVEVHTRNGPIVGVIGAKPPHLIPSDKRSKLIEAKDMYIDIGASSSDEATVWGIRPGDPVVPVSPFTTMHNEKLVLTKAWDNRIGCALVIEILRHLQEESHPNIIYGAGTIQEEVGLRGAQTMSSLVEPDIGFALEACPAADTPDVPADEVMSAVDKGPVISIYDRSMIAHTGLRDLVVDCAEAEGIPFQYRVGTGSTDAGKIHLHGRGVPSLVVSVPTRYIHSHNSLLHMDDVMRTVLLMVAVIKRIDEQAIDRIKA